MLILVICSILLTSGILFFTFYNGFTSEVKSELKNKAIFLEQILNLADDKVEYLNLLNISNTESRITLIAPDGTVLYDNAANVQDLENHSDRQEFKEAQSSGIGESKRISKTIGEETYYYALKLNSNFILRVAKTTSSIYGMFFKLIPQSILIIIVILILCLLFAGSLTKKIIEPINNLSFDKNINTYDELSPFIRTIMSQKKHIQDALNEITKKSDVIEAISGSMKEGLILTNKDGIVLLANKSALSILNIDKNPNGKNILELTRVVLVLDHLKLALNGENSEITLTIDSKDYNMFFSSVDKGALILFLDVTEKVKSEKMRREFSANVSHELKTPLTTISGFAELLSKGMVKAEDVINVSKKVKNETQRLIVLIEDIIRLSELDESESKRVYEEFDLTFVINEVAENLKSKADVSMLAFVLPNNEHYITANMQMIYDMIYNLLENAIKYNKPGGQICVKISNDNEKTRISIIDTGIGIDKKHHDRIFERFYRVDKSRSKKIRGTGLGLSIVKHIVSYHRGTVDVKSEPDKGTEITIELPSL